MLLAVGDAQDTRQTHEATVPPQTDAQQALAAAVTRCVAPSQVRYHFVSRATPLKRMAVGRQAECMLHSSGKGWWIPVFTFGVLVATEAAVRAVFANDHYYQEHGWPILLGFCVSALICRTLIQPPTGRVGDLRPLSDRPAVRQKPEGTFLFVKLRFWPPLLVVLGVVFGVLVQLHILT